MRSSTGAAAATPASVPPHMTARVPAAAPGGPPLTGQSRYSVPTLAASTAASRATPGAIVEVSMMMGGGASAVTMSSTTSITCSESVTDNRATSAPSTAATTPGARRAGRPSALAGVRA